jgi:site-specific recombinase XerD
MRHSFATIMLGKGASIFKVSRWLGHSDIRVTQNVYAHLLAYDSDINLMSIRESTTSADSAVEVDAKIIPFVRAK